MRCGEAAQALMSDACAEPMIGRSGSPGVRDLPFACFTRAKGNVASPARTRGSSARCEGGPLSFEVVVREGVGER